ncbi:MULTISPECIES: glycoside hydrolase family 3 N-terminal domain-containing protein [unclassified Enterococcus]|uniref:glycoside hydrolase family 3 N-terminal domain-containing protein n=1 Tax=unclassified Enterococcus TaxID=2608891 RepID=UPI0024745A59|nr:MULTISPECIES: glycoside hydrolase family 3 N-terminal domain-containing protein [unclassified Enterococcus]
MKKTALSLLISSSLLCIGSWQTKGEYTTEEYTDGVTTFVKVTNPNGGETLSYAKDSGLKLINRKVDGYRYAFKDANSNGKLDTWEDWRKEDSERATALAKELSKEEIAGLMLFSSHERNPENGLTEDQMKYLKDDNLRNVLNAGGNNAEDTVKWNNEMQAYVEALSTEGHTLIPVNFSSDPRSTAGSDAQYNSDGADISRWPSNLGIAATFDPDIMSDFAQISSTEYRALGIATALGPQIDLATEPRWLRVEGTYGEDRQLATDMAEAYVSGIQSSYAADGTDLGWGSNSVNAMIKHFPGDGAGEGGREAHTNAGKYAVYPGDNAAEHVEVFVDGGLNLTSKTGQAASVMSSYSIGVDKNGEAYFGELAGSAYDSEKMDLLRVDNDYEGIICTDWGVTTATSDPSNPAFGMAWGKEDLSVEERHYQILLTGTDMFGGNNDAKPVLAAYDMWQKDYEAGKLPISADERFQQSGKRLVQMIMQANLFEDPYLITEESVATLRNKDYSAAGYEAQLNSVVMLKNADETIHASDLAEYKEQTVYIPSSLRYGFPSIFSPAVNTANPTMDVEVAKQYFKEVLTDTPVYAEDGETVVELVQPDLTNVDMVIVGMLSPDNGSNFSSAGLNEEGFYPLSLQYSPYTADGDNVRLTSLGGDILADGTKENRTYYGKTSKISNEYDLTAVLNAQAAVAKVEEETGKEIPVVVALKATNPVIVGEFEDAVDAIVTGFSVSDQALFEIILGKHEPKGLLPVQFPADMDTVEAQFEDTAHDMVAYNDGEYTYDFGFGLNYDGQIADERVAQYVNK